MCGANVRLDQEGRGVNGAASLPGALEQRPVVLLAEECKEKTNKQHCKEIMYVLCMLCVLRALGGRARRLK